MKEVIKKLLRSIQVYFPFLQDIRFSTQRFFRKAFETPHEEDFLFIKKFPADRPLLFVDIGANRGDAILSMLILKKNCEVVAFEPNPIVYAKAQRMFARSKRVTIHNCGLGSQTGKLTLHLPLFRNFMFDGLASFDRGEAANWLKGRIYGYSDSKLKIREISCSVNRLDNYDMDPYFIKIDVQGHEHEVLKGAEQTLRKSKPVLLIETPSQDVMNFLAALSYSPFYYENEALQYGRGVLNTYFIPEEKKYLLTGNTLVDDRGALADADAHGSEAIPAAPSFQFVKK